MSDDPLDREISVSASLTETGIEAKAKSRAMAAFDRLLGNVVESANIPLERRNARARAVMEGEKSLIEAATRLAVERLKVDPEFAERAVENHFNGILRKQENRDAVVKEAVEQLKIEPPTKSDADAGPAELDDSFMTRLEFYSDNATTAQLREKWARILASEIRQPGTFSNKAMRLVDELDASTAKLFESLCANRFNNWLPKGIVGELTFEERTTLVSADLLLNPGLGQTNSFSKIVDNSGSSLWLMSLGNFAISFPGESRYDANKSILSKNKDGAPALPVYVLTSAGAAISTVLPSKEEAAFGKLSKYLQENLPTVEFREYRRSSAHSDFKVLRIIPPRSKSN